jgi:hypothetical protein
MGLLLISLLAVSLALPAPTVQTQTTFTLAPNTPFIVAADPVADTGTDIIVTGYRLWRNGVSVTTLTKAAAVVGGMIQFPHTSGLPAGKYIFQLQTLGQRVATGESVVSELSLSITLVTETTTLPSAPSPSGPPTVVIIK